MFSLRVCVAIGVVGLVVCSVLVGISFSSIQMFLFNLNVQALAAMPTFYSFILSFVGFAGSVGLILKKPSTAKTNSNLSKPKSEVSSEDVGSSGASGFVTLLPGTKLQNESGTTLELAEHYIMWPKFAKSDVPEEPKKAVKKLKRFFERVED